MTTKAHLLNLYLHLNPVELRRRIDEHVLQLWKTVAHVDAGSFSPAEK